jgi:hypothetical protein
MSALSDYAELKVLDHTLGTSAWSMPATVYLGLSVASMGDDASGTELSGSGYARQSISFASASSGSASTDATVTFPTATGSWGSIGFWSLWDASSAGNLLMHGAFTTAKTVGDGDILRVNSGDLTITAA